MPSTARRSDTIAIAKLLNDERLVPYADVVALLQRIDRAHPSLAFADFVLAIHLAYLSQDPAGRS